MPAHHYWRVTGALVLLLWGQTGLAQLAAIEDDLPPLFRERLAFDVADTDNDGLVSEAEFARDTIAGFTALDDDRTGQVTPEALGEHDPALFARVDADADGRLSFDEVMSFKMQAFEDADIDADGSLSFDEMLQAARSELGEIRR